MKIYYDSDMEIAKKYGWSKHLNQDDGLCITQDQGRLAIRDLSEPSWDPLSIDFLDAQWSKRLKKIQNETQLIKRAIGLKPHPDILIWDATAGLGRDTIVLAHLGFSVVAVERSPILFEILSDALKRASLSDELKETISRIDLKNADSKILLSNLSESERPDVVYLDPMYPTTKKSAQPKKDMQILRKLLGPDDNLPELLEAARLVAKKKVILKNHPRASLNLRPKHSLEMKSVRFDIF